MNVVAFAKPSKALPMQQSVILITGGKDASGCLTWFFVRVPNAKLRMFERTLKNGHINLDEFGEVLDSGFGEYPPAYVITEMKTLGYREE